MSDQPTLPYQLLIQHLDEHLNLILPHQSEMNEAYKHALFPPGKLFRPLLVWSIYSDLYGLSHPSKSPSYWQMMDDHALLASFTEIHHVYTLIHDDLPCMDNDDYRRGRPSVHKAFGEWQALLAGDGLLVGSYFLLSKLSATNLGPVIKLASKCLGPQGLIFGQYLDLSTKQLNNFSTILEIHKLKTSRLFQVALLGSALCLNIPQEKSKKLYYDLYRLGHHLGLLFQLLDDFFDLTGQGTNEHEKIINPYHTFFHECINQLALSWEAIEKIINKHQLTTFNILMEEYFKKCQKLMNNVDLSHLEKAKNKTDLLRPIQSLLQRMSIV